VAVSFFLVCDGRDFHLGAVFVPQCLCDKNLTLHLSHLSEVIELLHVTVVHPFLAAKGALEAFLGKDNLYTDKEMRRN
jgi:hypothetical protein